MRVLFRGSAVRRPSGVADPELAVERLFEEHVLEARELAGAPSQLEAAVCTTASPAESYPRYSSRFSPSIRIGTTGLGPT